MRHDLLEKTQSSFLPRMNDEASRLLRELAQQTDARALAACTESLLSLSHSKPFASAVAERDGAPLLVALLDNASAVVRAGAASCLATLCARTTSLGRACLRRQHCRRFCG